MPDMLEGRLVSLRAIERDDVPRLHELLETDMDVMTRASDRPPRPTSLAESISFYEGLSKRDNPPMWFAVEVNGEVVGECGLHRIDHYHGTCHVGISLGKAYWSKGYGRDALRTLVGFAFHHLRMRKVSLEVLADDERAVRAYQAVGFQQEGRFREESWFDGALHDVLRLAVLGPEWEGRAAAGPLE